MNQNLKRTSRFEPQNQSAPKNMNYGGNFGSGMSYNQNDVFSTRDMGPTSYQTPPNQKTPEQLAFDLEFSKWEKSFEDWKRSFATHPDRSSYREYENKFLDVRSKLLQKREQIYSVKTNNFDSMLDAADSMANSILSKFGGPSDSSSMRNQPPPSLMTLNPMSPMMGRQPQILPPVVMPPQINPISYSMPQTNQMSYSMPQQLMAMSRENDFRSNDRDFGSNDRDFRSSDRDFGSNDRDFRSSDRDRDRDRTGRVDMKRPDDRNSSDRRSNDRDRNKSRGGSVNDRSRSGGAKRDDRAGRNDRKNDSRGGKRGGGRTDARGGQRGGRGGGRNASRGGSQRGGGVRRDSKSTKTLPKPSYREVENELKRFDVYPFNKWYNSSLEERPPLVGKRKKRKNAKIMKVIERKRQIASGEFIQGAQAAKSDELPFDDRVAKLFEEALLAECPKMLPGSGRRRLKNIRAKQESTWTDAERKFIAFVQYITEKRSKYFADKKLAEGGEAEVPKEAMVTE